MSGAKKIKTIVYEEVSLPSDLKANKRAREMSGGERLPPSSSSSFKPSSSFSSSSSSSSSSRHGKRTFTKPGSKENEEFREKKEELRKMMAGVKEFTANSQLGKSRKQFVEEKLTRLGALPVKQQKMPFKVRLRIDAAQKKREQRKVEELKESDEVVSMNLKKMKAKKKEKIENKKKKQKLY